MENLTNQENAVWTPPKTSENGTVIFVYCYIQQPNGSVLLAEQLKVKESIALYNFGTNTVDVPFGEYIPKDIKDLKEKIPESEPLENFQVKFLLPLSAVGIEASHQFEIHFDWHRQEKYRILEFNLGKNEIFRLEYTDYKEANRYQQYLFWSGLLLGLGIPLTLSSLIEFFKGYMRNRTYETKNKNNNV